MTATRHTQTPTAEEPFATTAEKYNTEYANGKVTGSNFRYHEVQGLSGYSERRTPGLSSSDVTKELAKHLAEYAEREGCPLQFQQPYVARYVWQQASRGMLAWDEVLNIVRANRKRDGHQQIAHHFGYCEVMGLKGSAKGLKIIKLIRYITQEGECAGCQTEFEFSNLTRDRIKPGASGGEYKLPNVQLMCQSCNNEKGDSHNK